MNKFRFFFNIYNTKYMCTDVYTICGYSLKFDGTGLKIIFYHLHKCCIIYNMTIL